jgi:hypothetical protein
MFKAVAMSMLVLTAAPASGPMAAETSDTPQLTNAPQAQDAIARARQVVAEQMKVGDDAIEVKHVEQQTWNDSGMGCAKPGSMTLQVITEGYVVAVAAQGKEYRVHVSGNRAFICDKPVLMRVDPKRPTNARGLDIVIVKARADLAQKLGVDISTIRVLGSKSFQWPDNSLDCPMPDQPVLPKPVNGFKISMQHAGRIYTYHTDLSVVRACPAIEAQ